MKTMQWTTIDREFNEWPSGPWDDEPDKVQWQDEATGLPCLAVRSQHSGHWCGYVGVSAAHPAFEKSYDDVTVSIHGGLTFSAKCTDHSQEAWQRLQSNIHKAAPDAEKYPSGDAARLIKHWEPCRADYGLFVSQCQATSICHIPSEGETDAIWWLGFDCAHCGDLSPSDYRNPEYVAGVSTGPWPTTYKSLAYVKKQCVELADQLAKMEK